MEIIGGSWGNTVKLMFGKSWGGKITKILIYTNEQFYAVAKYKPHEVDEVTIINQANQATIGRGIAGSVIGTVVAGPIGLVAGAVIGMSKNRQLMLVIFNDGNRLIIQGKPKEMKVWFGLGRLVA